MMSAKQLLDEVKPEEGKRWQFERAKVQMSDLRARVGGWAFAARRSWSRWHRSSRPTTASDLRVLYAEKSYPQLSESYISAEIAFVRRLGVAVAVWAEREPNTPAED